LDNHKANKEQNKSRTEGFCFFFFLFEALDWAKRAREGITSGVSLVCLEDHFAVKDLKQWI